MYLEEKHRIDESGKRFLERRAKKKKIFKLRLNKNTQLDSKRN